NAYRVASIQARRLRKTLAFAGRRSPHYREGFGKAGFPPAAVRSTADLRRLPFTTAADIRDWRRFLCVPETGCAPVLTTLGSHRRAQAGLLPLPREASADQLRRPGFALPEPRTVGRPDRVADKPRPLGRVRQRPARRRTGRRAAAPGRRRRPWRNAHLDGA